METHKVEPKIKLDNFAQTYRTLLESGANGVLLSKCMSDYKYESGRNDVCFTIDNNDNLKDKDGTVLHLTDHNGRAITASLLKNNLDYGNEIKFSDIQDKQNTSSYHFDPYTFMNDWRDLRTSLGDIKKK